MKSYFTTARVTGFLLALIFVCAGLASIAQSGDGDLTHFPKGTSPGEIGKLVADRFVVTPHTNFGKPTPPKVITYPESCAWYGALTFAKVSGDKTLLGQLTDRFEPFFGKDSALIPIPDHVDYSVFGAVPFELYMQTKEQKYLTLGKRIADNQWAPPSGPRVTADSRRYYTMGLTWQTRLWVDDMFMITAVQTQAYRATGDKTYLDHAAAEAVTYLDSLQKPNGLFYHAPDVPYFWGRGVGWFAVGMAELLRSLPKNHKDRPRIMQGFQTMMASLRQYQTQSGMWNQLIDDPASWPEMSCTGMFTFAMITGVKEGWLDKKIYAPVARKGWLGLVTYINADGDTREVCEGTNKKNDRQYYLDRKRNVGDLHGQAPVLWCATALLR
ncbi:MAG: glycoside hydrolase family 88 protein [Sediminibacterium sp.]